MKAKRGIPVTKFKSQIIVMKNNGLNVEHFRYHITINYDKSATSGKNESRALIFYKKFCKVDPLQFRMMYYSYFYEQKLLQVVSIEKNAIDCAGASMSLSAQTRMQRTFIWFNVKTLLYA